MRSHISSAGRSRRLLPVLLGVVALSACQSFQGPLPPQPQSPPSRPAQPEEPPTQQKPEPPAPTQPPQRQFRLSAASTALVSQAQKQVKSGDTVAATATLERALRIEPDNPLLWIELGRLRLDEHNPKQAHSLGRKALVLATGDAHAQASAWRLIADSLRAQDRNDEAQEAEQRASALLFSASPGDGAAARRSPVPGSGRGS